MQLSDFFLFREAFYRHVRNKLKNKPFDLKLSTFNSMSSYELFNDFAHSKLLTETGKSELIASTKMELKRLEQNISKQIADCQEQITLTENSTDIHVKKIEYIKKMNKRIEYLSASYTPKFPTRDQHTFRSTSFVNGKFIGLNGDVETGLDVDVTYIHDVVLVRLKEVEKLNKKQLDMKDQVIYLNL
jgi:hypothetical protein